MRTFTAALIALLVASPAGAVELPINASNFREAIGMQAPNGTKVDVYNTPHARGRVVLIHGLSGSRAAMRTGPYTRLVAHLRAQGYQVIVPSLPYDTGATQAANLRAPLSQHNGSSYAHSWDRRFSSLMGWADKRYGKSPTIVGGISWGGMHALRAAAKNPEVQGYFVHEPVVDPNQLTEFRGLPVGNLNPTRYAQDLDQKQGFISYGGADTRVGVTPTRALIQNLVERNAHLQTVQYPTLNHTTNLESVNNILRWTRRERKKLRYDPSTPVPGRP